MRSFVSFLGGALSVGLVVGVLAFTGVIDDDPAPSTAPTTAAPSPPTAPSEEEDRPVASRPKDISDLYKRVQPGVVLVQANQGTGFGFVYDDEGHIVTNDHVVEGSTAFSVRIGAETKPIPAQLMGKDPSSDLAVLKVDPSAVPGGLKPLELGDSSALEPGDQAIAIGSPFGLEGSVTTGIVSSLGRTIEAPNGFPIANAVQTDARDQPRQLGRPAARRQRPRDRRQLADQDRQRRERRRRLRRPGLDRQVRRAADQGRRQGRTRLHGRREPDERRPLRRPREHRRAGRPGAAGRAAAGGQDHPDR